MSELTANKSLGQHFLRDHGVIKRIVDCLHPTPGETVVEIGPGLGALTFEIAPRVGQLHLVEVDRRLVELLKQKTGALSNVSVHYRDALKFDYCGLGSPIRIVGNLPYNISTPLIFRFMDYLDCISDLVLMLQNEVVERMVAPPGSRTYGRLSVTVQQKCTATKLFEIGQAAFTPPPKVRSAVVALSESPGARQRLLDPRHFDTLVQTAFSKRRKTLRNALRGFLDEEQISACDIDPRLRAEQLSVQDFERLSNRWAQAPTQ